MILLCNNWGRFVEKKTRTPAGGNQGNVATTVSVSLDTRDVLHKFYCIQ